MWQNFSENFPCFHVVKKKCNKKLKRRRPSRTRLESKILNFLHIRLRTDELYAMMKWTNGTKKLFFWHCAWDWISFLIELTSMCLSEKTGRVVIIVCIMYLETSKWTVKIMLFLLKIHFDEFQSQYNFISFYFSVLIIRQTETFFQSDN